MTKREAIKGLDRLKTIIRKESNMQIALNMAIEALEQDRPKGHWIKEENPNLGVCLKKVYICSNCNVAVGCQYFVRKSFCPNCGADMRSKEK